MKFFIDIGTHYGEGLLEFNKKLGISKGWIIHCFEPNSLTKTEAGIASATSKWLSPIVIHRKAVWNETGKVMFLCSKRDPGELEDHYIAQWPECYLDESTRNNETLDGVSSHISGVRQDTWGGETLEIESISASDVLESICPSDGDEVYVKIDAEGAEREIIQSLVTSRFLKNVKSIYCEVHEGLATNGVTVSEISSLCSRNGIKFERWV